MADIKKKEKISKGTKMAAEVRSKANKLSDAQRQELTGVAMALIYSEGNAGIVRSSSR